MKITSLKIRKFETETRLVATASIILDNLIVIHDIKVISGSEGNHFLAMPSKKIGESFRDITHPINAEARAAFERIIIGLYEAMPEDESVVEMFTVSDRFIGDLTAQQITDFNPTITDDAVAS